MVKTISIEKLFLHILIYTYLLLPIILLFTKIKTKDRISLGIYGALCFLMLSSYFYGYLKSSFLYFTIYTFLEYVFFASFVWLNLNSKKLKAIIGIFSFFFIAFQIFSYSEFSKNTSLDSIPVGIETILMFIYITFFFYERFQSDSSELIYEHRCFWLCMGMLIYLGGTFFFNILIGYLHEEQVDKYWFLTYIADILKNLLFAVSLIIHIKGSTRESLHHQKHLPYLDLDMN